MIGAQLAQVGAGLLGGADVGLGDDLHQRHAGAVEVDQGEARMLVVQRLAGILLDVQALDADVLAGAVGEVDADDALADQRPLVLRDLIAGRQIGVEVVLPLEHALQIDRGVDADAGAHRLLDAAAVEHRQHAGEGGVDQAHLGIRLGAEVGGGTGEQLRLGDDLGVHFEPDHHFPVAGVAVDQIGHAGRSPRRLKFASGA